MSDDERERSARDAHDASDTPDSAGGNQMMIQPGEHLDAEVVSAWLDAPEDFSEQNRLALETHLSNCAECRQIAAELTAIVRAFRALPMVDPSHSFGLSAESAGLTATPTLPASQPPERPAAAHAPYPPAAPWYARQMSSLRWATAIASMLLVFLLSADLVNNVDFGGDDDDDAMIVMEARSTSNDEAGPASTPASSAAEPEDNARGSAAEPTIAADEDSATGGQEDASAPAEDEAPENESLTTEDAGTMLAIETPLPGEADGTQQTENLTSGYSPQETLVDAQESSMLHLLELALAISIAWLIVAMIALPRWRQPRM